MYATIDLETTGLNSILDEICEIAIVIYDKDFKLKKEFRQLLKTYNPIPEDVTLIHGISNEMVESMPYFDEIMNTVLDLLEGQILCGQNIRKFDIPFLAEQFFKMDVVFDTTKIKTLDTFVIEQVLNPRDLGTLYKKYTGKELVDAHSALVDCKASMEVLMGQIKTYDLDVTSDSFNDMLGVKEIYVDPSRKLMYIDGAVCWTMGKYKDKPVGEDLGYANWALSADFPKSTKYYIQKEIDKTK